MHTRRLITFLLGAWFTLILTIGGVATIAFQVAHNVSKAPPGEAALALHAVEEPMREPLFRYAAAEINRKLFELTGLGELAILFALASLLLLQNYSRAATILAGVMLLAATASYFLLTPQVVALGRILDFRPVEMALEDRARFAKVHMLYGATTVFRLLCGVWLGGIMLYRGSNSRMRRRRGNGDTVDNSQDSHIDG
jgi:hypothetical protein